MASAIAEAITQVRAALPGGGEERLGQIEMAEAVARAIGEGHHLVVQAGTGTGKSLAYLIPALLSGQKVVVATATTTSGSNAYSSEAQRGALRRARITASGDQGRRTFPRSG